MIRIAVAGARGRMGRAVQALADARSDVAVVAGFDLGDPVFIDCDAIIDFTSAEASTTLAEKLILAEGSAGRPALVVGSTGFSPAQIEILQTASRTRPLVRSGNFSLGVNVLLGLVRQAAERLSSADWDIEIFEAHHRRKVDAPSGTALMLGEAAAEGRKAALDALAVRVRDGLTGPRAEGDIGFSVMRGGGIVGEHSAVFAAEDEILTLSHSARDRSLFARGALEAAIWAARQPAGLYDMQDVLGFTR
jgi:4-hydroxy-tetrahydrodipicolinate reductase